MEGAAEQMTAHVQHQKRRGEREAYPEPATHILKFGVGLSLRRDHGGLQRHAADGTGAGSRLTNLRMHRTGVDRGVVFRPDGGRARLVQISTGIGNEFCLAAGGAEVEGVSVMLNVVSTRRPIDRHSADRVDRDLGFDPIARVHVLASAPKGGNGVVGERCQRAGDRAECHRPE